MISSAKATDSQIESEVSETIKTVSAAAKISEPLTSGSSPTSKTVKHPDPKSVKDLQDIFSKWIEDAEIPESISHQPTTSSATTSESSGIKKESFENKNEAGDENGNENLNRSPEMEMSKSQSHESTSVSDLYHEIRDSVATGSRTENDSKVDQYSSLENVSESPTDTFGKVRDDNDAKPSNLSDHNVMTSPTRNVSSDSAISDGVSLSSTTTNSKQAKEQSTDQVTASEEIQQQSPDSTDFLKVFI